MTFSLWHHRYLCRFKCVLQSLLIVCALLASCNAAAQSGRVLSDTPTKEIVEKKKPEPKNPDTQIVINYDDEAASEEAYRSEFGQLFNNPALASGLSSGSAFINRSIESVMEIVFYRLLDQELVYDINDHAQFKYGVNRELFQVGAGSFVVVDRFSVGPNYMKELRKIQQIPVNFGVEGRVNVFDIYLTTDAMRLAEHADKPVYRQVFNNWFGLLPFISKIMPPSFNPNELYDPLNLVEVPFSFPVSVGGFRAMPIGAIRSYNVSGGVSLPVDLAGRVPNAIKDSLARADEVDLLLPYSVFAEGEYRINVLRRSKNIAWVGLTKVKRWGHRFSASLGRSFKLLDKLILAQWWSGMPAKIFPLDATWAKSKLNVFHQLYEFDLRKAEARNAYKQAVKGNFVPAMRWHKARSEKNLDTGVRFHFTQKDDGWESASQTRPNLLILNSRREDVTRESEIEITDEDGKFYVLRANQQVNDEFVEALTGRQREIINSHVEMEVDRVPDPDHPGAMIYQFDPNSKTPIEVTFSMRLQDRYLDAHEYKTYIERIREFTLLPLHSAPNIRRRDPALHEERLRSLALADPLQNQFHLKVTPTYLGSFSATAAIRFSSDLLDAILELTPDEQWRALAKAYGVSVADWGTRQSRNDFTRQVSWGHYGVMRPFVAFNIRSAAADFIAEATSIVNSLGSIYNASTPIEKLAHFFDLFETAHPEKLARAFLLMSDQSKVPRSVTFSTSAKGKASKDTKDAFRELNGKTFRSVVQVAPVDRSRLPDQKLREFFPDEVKERRARPKIKKIDISMRNLPSEYLARAKSDRYFVPEEYRDALEHPHVYMRLYITNMSPSRDGKIYLRTEEAGQLDLGKFTLGEEVISVSPMLDSDAKLGTLVYEFFITGPLSPFQSTFFRSAVGLGGEFRLGVAASMGGRVWSDERSVQFVLANGALLPP